MKKIVIAVLSVFMFVAALALAPAASAQSVTVFINCNTSAAPLIGEYVTYKGAVDGQVFDEHGETATKSLPFYNGGDGSYTTFTYWGGNRINGNGGAQAFTQGSQAAIARVTPFCFNIA